MIGGVGGLPTDPSNFLELADDTFQLNLLYELCFVCRQQNDLVTVLCCRCHRYLHLKCLFLREWRWIRGVVCGCKRGTKTPRVSPQETRTIACAELESLLQPIYRIDCLKLLTKNCPYEPDTLPESVVASFFNKYPLFDCLSDGQLNWVVAEPEEPKKRMKTCTEEAVDSIPLPENLNVADFSAYEDTQITDLEFLVQTRVREMYYFSLDQFLKDFRTLNLNKLQQWSTDCAKRYLNFVWEQSLDTLLKGQNRLRQAIRKDWELCRSNHCSQLQVTNWHKQAFPSRAYVTVHNYVAATGDEHVLQRLITSKHGACDGQHCNSLEGIGGLDLVNDTWASLNTDRRAKVECTRECRCSEASCLNRAISLQRIQRLGVDLEEQETWGFDKFTYVNLVFYCRQPINDADQNQFISRTLAKAINAVSQDNWDISQALKLILADPQYTLLDKRYAQGLLNVVDGLREALGQEEASLAFRVHPKGTGVICRRSEGIKANELIIEYFGELYSPARWYEKQDVIKQLSKAKRGDLPDFYNILLERHSDDPDGYDTVMVDPIVKGSFASRLSHSCNPNCGTVVTVANGRYTIGMYALTDIQCGEELTFDYHSVTESLEEHEAAICLCATAMCRGHYLAFSKANSCTKYMLENYNFLTRVSSLLKVCAVQALTHQDATVLHAFNFSSALLGNTPVWLQAWCAAALQFVSQEMEVTQDEFERRSMRDSRVQNLAITVDRVKYALSAVTADLSTAHPPLSFMDDSEILNFYWGDEASLKTQLMKNNSEILEITQVLNRPCSSVLEAKKNLLEVRDLLRLQGREDWRYQGVSDILHLHVFTHMHFRSLTYKSHVSENIEVRFCDLYKVPPPDKALSDVFKIGSKAYSSSYIEGALVGWFKQSVVDPAASLTSDKRGTLTLSCIYQNMTEPYSEDLRRHLLKHIRDKPSMSWPVKIDSRKMPWVGFANSTKVHGTPMFDAAYYNCPQILEECLACIDSPAQQAKEVLMTQVERLLIN
jgi:hypothetical protein